MDSKEKIKLQKYFTDCGIMSRRAAEIEISAGKVTVNGEKAVTGQRIDPERDVVVYAGKRISLPESGRKIYIMLNKPRGYVTTMSDDRGRATVSELVAGVGERVYPIGRLDMDSDGLLLLTNDGELANKLTHPRHQIPKIYHVKISGVPDMRKIKALGEPMTIDGYKILPVRTELISVKSGYFVLKMTLYEGRNRQIRKMCQAQEMNILRLCRVAVGEIKLGDLAPGKWRFLTPSQINYLTSLPDTGVGNKHKSF